MELSEGLERIEFGAFLKCTSLQQINIPPTVKVIGAWAFHGCSQLGDVELHEGLVRIEDSAFRGCHLLRRIHIPSTVIFIHENAFKGSTSSTTIEFCEEIEQFVHEAKLPWLKQRVSEASLRTYSFLVQFKIPVRLNQIKKGAWRDNIRNMLQRVPENLNEVAYFDSIATRLSNYEHLQEVAPLLELVLWKAQITKQSSGNLINDDTKIRCRNDSFSMFNQIFPNIFPFLFEE